jgi:hypothetical protein
MNCPISMKIGVKGLHITLLIFVSFVKTGAANAVLFVMGVNEIEHALTVEPCDIFKVNSASVKSVFTSRTAPFAILYCGTTNEKLQFGVL